MGPDYNMFMILKFSVRLTSAWVFKRTAHAHGLGIRGEDAVFHFLEDDIWNIV